MKTPELKPCPFCGGEKMEIRNTSNHWQCFAAKIVCECDAAIEIPSNSYERAKEIAVTQWNTRTPQQPQLEDVAALKAKIDFIHQSYATTYHRLHQWMRENAPENAKQEYFSIIANGTASPFEQPTYAQQFNTLLHKIQAYEKAFEDESKKDEILSIWKGRALYEIIDDQTTQPTDE